jgi:hypothetical protein
MEARVRMLTDVEFSVYIQMKPCCSGGIAISPSGGTSITIDISFADAVLFG